MCNLKFLSIFSKTKLQNETLKWQTNQNVSISTQIITTSKTKLTTMFKCWNFYRMRNGHDQKMIKKKSTTGYFTLVSVNLVSWKSKKSIHNMATFVSRNVTLS